MFRPDFQSILESRLRRENPYLHMHNNHRGYFRLSNSAAGAEMIPDHEEGGDFFDCCHDQEMLWD